MSVIPIKYVYTNKEATEGTFLMVKCNRSKPSVHYQFDGKIIRFYFPYREQIASSSIQED